MDKLKMKNLILLATFLVAYFGADALGSAVQRFTRDIKPPTQAMLEHQSWATPIVATTNTIKTTFAGPTSAAAVTLTSFTAQPDFPRNLTITPTGTTADILSCDIVVSGTNIYGASISETLHFNAAQSVLQVGTKAFKTVTSVVWPASCEGGGFAATWIIGVGNSLGLQHCTDKAGKYAFSIFNNVYESTRGTMYVNSSAVESNLFAPNGTMDGTKAVDLYWVQNFGCGP